MWVIKLIIIILFNIFTYKYYIIGLLSIDYSTLSVSIESWGFDSNILWVRGPNAPGGANNPGWWDNPQGGPTPGGGSNSGGNPNPQGGPNNSTFYHDDPERRKREDVADDLEYLLDREIAARVAIGNARFANRNVTLSEINIRHRSPTSGVSCSSEKYLSQYKLDNPDLFGREFAKVLVRKVIDHLRNNAR